MRAESDQHNPPCILQVELAEQLGAEAMDASGCMVMPGLVDMHVHITGGGGEAGPASRTPESTLSAFLDAGITTVVGLLGTDCITRRQVRPETCMLDRHPGRMCSTLVVIPCDPF